MLTDVFQQVDGYTPGVDYPIYDSVPFGLTFTCGGKLPGYYADPEARCQVTLDTGVESNYDTYIIIS